MIFSTQKKFLVTLKRYGHTIYLQRRSDGVASGPYQEIEGGRYLNKVEAWTAYRVIPVAQEEAKGEGFVENFDAVFYVQPTCEPSRSDLISEKTDWERFHRHTYKVESSVPFYLGNRLVFFKVNCMRVTPIS